MHGDAAVFSEPAGKSAAFNQLLSQLRSVHFEVCARNAQLEQQVAYTSSLGKVESKADDPWLPINFLAPDDSPPLRRLPWGIHTPRPASTDERLSQSIDKLVRQHEHLNRQISQVLQPSTASEQIWTTSESVQPESNGSYVQSLNSLSIREVASSGSMTKVLSVNKTRGMTPLVKPHATPSMQMQAKVKTHATASLQARLQIAESKARTTISSEASTAVQSFAGAAFQRFHVATGDTKEFGKCVTTGLELVQKDDETKLKKVRQALGQVLVSQHFNVASTLVIFSYAVLIAIETNMIAEDPDMDSLAMKILHYVYTCIFLVELMLRFAADGWGALCGADALWNRLDLLLIIFGIVEIIMEMSIGSTEQAASAVRVVRMGRMIRTVRLVRTFRQFHDFQKMAYALISSFKTLVCSSALLMFVMFFFAVWLTQSAADAERRAEIENLDLRYGHLMSTAYTLFLSVSGGISWDVCYLPLHSLNWVSAQVFLLYIVIVLFGVLNVVTSVFVESIIRSVQHQKDLIVQDKEEEKRIAMNHVQEVFRYLDSDGSGKVSIDEMEYFLGDPALRKYMEALDIEAEDTRLLFKLLDSNSSGVISVSEFCDGCLRMRGNARSIDIHALTYRIRNFLDRWGEFTGYVEDSFSQIRQKLS